jgi:hypothetical protein
VGNQSDGGPAQSRLATSTRTCNKDALIGLNGQVKVMNRPSIRARVSVGDFFKVESHEGVSNPVSLQFGDAGPF